MQELLALALNVSPGHVAMSLLLLNEARDRAFECKL